MPVIFTWPQVPTRDVTVIFQRVNGLGVPMNKLMSLSHNPGLLPLLPTNLLTKTKSREA